ncbi:MAG: ParA family protein [Microcystis aeruginosa Ma_QC_Ch_20071001_S25]|jgi:chromosome partitioning protein|uniref:ParA family protein n=5 Tax=Microcystis TaxID=1125 RepID=A0A552HDJ6_MICVR|nr:MULTISPECIES: ParA family protein [Microcystis]MCA2764835.1 ParA family protein [Microcystis sp. M151S2]MCA2928250.1 ParA family protein [Microcystis sp. M020S1]MCA2935858.1 ParA family protein [Microcystis sp. M015S1]MCU7245478.1 ParA family protein [Microcystis aeruginosa WS75]NCQ70006.1 ParA family protein [Microcystis aeruginosa W13-16]NCQ74534.1 ParA family protein [Microcystis aeruginosa W13-13]NCQ78996.1 ParA family protein [Microcystis aeruginosa W13-15]NCQ83560.1 ParA family pro
MIISVVALKGGVGKTTTSIHLAAYFQEKAPTLLIDADKNRSALHWSREDTLPFMVASQAGATGLVKQYTHIIVDTQARPEPDELKDLAQGSDLLILPTTPNHLDIDVTIKAVELLSTMTDNYRVLLTQVDSRTKTGREARKALEEAKLPLFKREIPRLVAFERAAEKAVIVKDYPDPRSNFGWLCYQAVGKEIFALMT